MAASSIESLKAGIAELLSRYEKLPGSIEEACAIASESRFVRDHIPSEILSIYCH